MTYQTIDQFNQTIGITPLLQTASNAVPFLPALILFAIFSIISIGTFYSQQRRFGSAKLSASCAIGGFVASIIALLMSLIPDFINGLTVVSAIVIEIVFVVWLIIDN